ncbi:MAG: class A beta-lactamase-related serine hydrolase [Melioribacteraceae bacterium]|nr:class A beta-lactamase-related serine hydrolase [Melioribacteraceae bacterium]
MKKIIPIRIAVISILLINFLGCREMNDLEKIISKENEKINKVVLAKDKYELQILYTKINKNEDGKVNFETISFNEKPNKYFYPASTVKFPAAILALEKLNDLEIEGVNKYTHLSIDSLYENHVSFDKDFKNDCGYPNIADYIKRVFLISDNEAFNRLYEFLGQKEINDRLRKRGFNNTKIVHRLSVARTPKQNMETNPINFYDGEGKLLYSQPARIESTDVKLDLEETLKGEGYYANGELVNEPKDFSQNNYFSLRDQHNLLIRIMYPEQFKEEERFNLTEEDYMFLRKYMSMLANKSDCPKYSSEDYWDSYVKFLIFGDSKEPMPNNIKIYNKVGDAYGYIIDNAYIVDEQNGVEFFLSATLHVNENQIYNDDHYEYDEIGFPFLAKLGKLVYDYEIEQK